MAILLPKSETAKFIRHRILDIAIDVMAERDNCHTSHVNRSIKYIFPAVLRGYVSCANDFQEAIDRYIESSVSIHQDLTGKDFKLSAAFHYNKIYEIIFGDKHEQYRDYLGQYTSAYECELYKYQSESRFRSYSSIENRLRIVLCHEIQQAIANIENLLAKEIISASKQQNRKIKFKDLDEIIANIENDSRFQPFITEARAKMATVDSLNSNSELLQHILSERKEAHFNNIAETNTYSFLIAKSLSLKDKLLKPEALAVFQRLKDK